MSRTSVALVIFLALLAIVAGLYATGPKYVVDSHPQSRFARIYCQNGYEQKRRQITTHPQPGVAYSEGIGCERRRDGWHWVSAKGSYTTLRRAAAWERVWYALVGSKNTRG